MSEPVTGLAVCNIGDEKSTWSEQRYKWAVRTPQELTGRCQELGREKYLINRLTRLRSLTVLIGDSGLGKTPLGYQIAVCVAAGVPFLDCRVNQGRVLYLDFENGIGQVEEMISRLTQHLALPTPPDELLLWNFNDAPGYSKGKALEMIREFEPSLVVVDSLTGYYPEIEEKNSNATRCYQEFRGLIRDCGCTILAIHNIRKPSGDFRPEHLETANLRQWFYQTRGPAVLINGSDVRLGADEPSPTGFASDEIDLVMRGFERVKGEIALTYLARDLDEQGEPLGWRRVTGTSLLPAEQREAFSKFPDSCRFKDAKCIYGRGDQATRDFLNKCISLGLLSHTPRGPYVKVDPESGSCVGLPPEETE